MEDFHRAERKRLFKHFLYPFLFVLLTGSLVFYFAERCEPTEQFAASYIDSVDRTIVHDLEYDSLYCAALAEKERVKPLQDSIRICRDSVNKYLTRWNRAGMRARDADIAYAEYWARKGRFFNDSLKVIIAKQKLIEQLVFNKYKLK